MTDDLKERLLSWQPGQDEEALREEAVARITDLESRLAAAEAGEDALAEALRPFGFFSDEPNTTQQAWEIRYCDRFEDWIDFGDMESARDALAAYEARRKGK